MTALYLLSSEQLSQLELGKNCNIERLKKEYAVMQKKKDKKNVFVRKDKLNFHTNRIQKSSYILKFRIFQAGGKHLRRLVPQLDEWEGCAYLCQKAFSCIIHQWCVWDLKWFSQPSSDASLFHNLDIYEHKQLMHFILLYCVWRVKTSSIMGTAAAAFCWYTDSWILIIPIRHSTIVADFNVDCYTRTSAPMRYFHKCWYLNVTLLL